MAKKVKYFWGVLRDSSLSSKRRRKPSILGNSLILFERSFPRAESTGHQMRVSFLMSVCVQHRPGEPIRASWGGELGLPPPSRSVILLPFGSGRASLTENTSSPGSRTGVPCQSKARAEIAVVRPNPAFALYYAGAILRGHLNAFRANNLFLVFRLRSGRIRSAGDTNESNRQCMIRQ